VRNCAAFRVTLMVGERRYKTSGPRPALASRSPAKAAVEGERQGELGVDSAFFSAKPSYRGLLRKEAPRLSKLPKCVKSPINSFDNATAKLGSSKDGVLQYGASTLEKADNLHR
jgi:hypothetical protein